MRRPADAAADLLLHLAVERVPASRRELMAAEWAAELHRVRAGEAPVGQLAFTASLARSRMPGDADDPLPAARVTAAARAVAAVALVAAAPGLALLLLTLIRVLVTVTAHLVVPSIPPGRHAPATTLFDLAPLVVAGIVVAALAHRLGGRVPVSRSDSRWLRHALTAPAVMVLTATGAVAADLVSGGQRPVPLAPPVQALAVTAIVWAALTLPLLRWATTRRRPGLLAAVLVGLLVLDLASTVGAVIVRRGHITAAGLLDWTPVAVLGGAPNLGQHRPTVVAVFDGLTGMPTILLLAGVFAVYYTHRASRPSPTVADGTRTADVPEDVPLPRGTAPR